MYFLSGLGLFLSCLLSSGQTNAGVAHLTHPASREAGIQCENDDHCQFFVERSKCIDRYCRCPDDHLLSSDASKCLEKANEYGSSCEDNIQCSHELSAGGICEGGTCKCKVGYHYLKGFCWKNSNLNEKCIKDEQCFSAYEYVGLRCESGACKCRKNYYERLHSGCRRERRIGESCNVDEDCNDGTTCEGGKCSGEEQDESPIESSSNATVRTTARRLNCPKGTFELKGECVLELGMKCNDDADCNHIANALCLDKITCGCQPATYVASENNRECLRAARGKVGNIVSTSCKKDSQCGVYGEGAICQNKRCACRGGSYWEAGSGLCWPMSKLGESCTSGKDCHPSETKADCLRNVCNCTQGYHPKGGVCVADALEVGDSCESDDECLFQNSFCDSSQVCACKEVYYPESGKCVPGVESDCVGQDDCAHLKNTECKMGNSTRKQCLCLENHSSSEDHRQCLPVKNFGEGCSETFQCVDQLGDLGECRDNVCRCRNQTHFSYGRCYQSKYLGDRCWRLPECYPGSDMSAVICLNGYCACNYDYEPDKTGICVKKNSGMSLQHSLSLIFGAILIALTK